MEIFRALAALIESPQEEHAPIAKALEIGPLPSADEYTETFLFNLYPYASVYLGQEGMMGGEACDRIAGFWRALNLTPPNEADHLATLLGLYANLYDLEEIANDKLQKAKWRHARKVLLWEHLLSWLPVYLHKLRLMASPFYRSWGEILERALIEESKKVGRPETISQHLLETLTLQDPREHGLDEFLASLISPVHAGFILTRADLQRAARGLNLGLRVAERKFILQTLFNQDAHAILAWLSNEADAWIEWHASQEEVCGATASAWKIKAEVSMKLLRELG